MFSSAIIFAGAFLGCGAIGGVDSLPSLHSTDAHDISPRLEYRADFAAASSPPNCFPALGFNMPGSVPSSLTNWWCNTNTEYAFVGFSYEVTDCEQ
jgi:hypothetical protein